MKKVFCFVLLLFHFSLKAQLTKAPAYPLITNDPYFSIWSFTDKLNESVTRHWTGAEHSLVGLLQVDGKLYDFLGEPETALQTVLTTGEDSPVACKYTEEYPGTEWMKENFDDRKWKTGKAPFSTGWDNKAATEWKSKDIWMRRLFDLSDLNIEELVLQLRHDDDVEVYINGELAYSCTGCYVSELKNFKLEDRIKNKLKKEKNILAMHCINTGGFAWLDAGLAKRDSVKNLQQAVQKKVEITATQTKYEFDCGPVFLSVDFLSPLLANDLDLFSRPVSYVTFNVMSNDGNPHEVKLLFTVSKDLVRNHKKSEVKTELGKYRNISYLKSGTTEQPVLKTKGDDVRIDWGYLY
ncbi:MAG TPA: DUF5127 domain-containing protein, partial [Chitinophagaceae bacterium]|nr:DUF5127 domain-containing protein [Chitinophagaceae bacterium]